MTLVNMLWKIRSTTHDWDFSVLIILIAVKL